MTALVDSAHATARVTAHGGSGGKAEPEDLLPRDGAGGRTIYVLEYARRWHATWTRA